MRSHQFKFITGALLVAALCVGIALFFQWRAHRDATGNPELARQQEQERQKEEAPDGQAGAHPFIQALHEGLEESQEAHRNRAGAGEVPKAGEHEAGDTVGSNDVDPDTKQAKPTPIKISPSASGAGLEE
jgi:flagellar biosynthesis/type III secretory pathway M-ring protein FliF/YscJ